ncbi:uncharacterized protein LOC107869183 [Capsicum annuum]|uniref:uncharacterized protein LOC107869183 n=1 Tax=Capsicum annuum TaxID=4072 RepID=UPI001FB0BF95|nr:uncharacterized protein LOC107869183 [Capsicum annuum]
MNILFNKLYMHSKIENEDKEEVKHRKAQFLIYKTLKKADSYVPRRKKSYWLKMKLYKLKIKIGRKLKKLRRRIMFTFSTSRSKV